MIHESFYRHLDIKKNIWSYFSIKKKFEKVTEWDVGRALQKLTAIVGILTAEKEE